MSRVSSSALTRIRIIRVACKLFLSKGYTDTSIKAICSELGMSPGNLTFHFPTKEHLLCELVSILCRFQWEMLRKQTDEGETSIMAVCLELMVMAAMCDGDRLVEDFLLSSYRSPICMEIIRKNDSERAKKIFSPYRPDWTDEQFAEAEILVSGIEYATFMSVGDGVSLERRISGAIEQVLDIYGIPGEMRQKKVERVLGIDYRGVACHMLDEFKCYVNDANEQDLIDLLKI